MANFVFVVKDASTGQPIANAWITGTPDGNMHVSTNPCPAWPMTGTCTTGPGYNFNGYTDSTGTFKNTIPYTCIQQLTGLISADGYDNYPFEQTTGSITGDVGFTILMTKSTLTPPAGQGFGAGIGQGLGLVGTNTTGGLSNEINTLGLYAAIAIVGLGLVAIAIVILMSRSGAGPAPVPASGGGA